MCFFTFKVCEKANMISGWFLVSGLFMFFGGFFDFFWGYE